MLDDAKDGALAGWCQELEAEVLALLKDRVGLLGDDLGLGLGETIELIIQNPNDAPMEDCLKVLLIKLRWLSMVDLSV